MRLDPGLRACVYVVFAALFFSGAAWLVADQLKDTPNGEWWQSMAANLLMIHGGSAMVVLVLLGALIPLHLRLSWRAGRNRITGSTMVACNAALIVTAFGLYYAGADTLRILASDMHIAVGLGLPALIATHIAFGRRQRTQSREPAVRVPVRSRGEAGALRPVSVSEDRASR